MEYSNVTALIGCQHLMMQQIGNDGFLVGFFHLFMLLFIYHHIITSAGKGASRVYYMVKTLIQVYFVSPNLSSLVVDKSVIDKYKDL